ncbi:MAG: GNAT family N-acetyltransferase, partial [Tepidiformaceae bacterium]
DYDAQLLGMLELALTKRGVRCTTIVITNDNLRAFHLYARRGYRLVGIHRDAMEHVRKIKPLTPAIGEDGIPLCDMWEFEKGL